MLTEPQKADIQETAVCRGCGCKLTGKPYYTGNIYAFDPVTKREAKINFYGGFVCSQECDFRSSLELEKSMPGHGGSQRTISDMASAKMARNWRGR